MCQRVCWSPVPACLETKPWDTSLLVDGSSLPALFQEEDVNAMSFSTSSLLADSDMLASAIELQGARTVQNQLRHPQPDQQEPKRRASFLERNSVYVQARYELTLTATCLLCWHSVVWRCVRAPGQRWGCSVIV